MQRVPCWALKCILSLVNARWSIMRSMFSWSMSRSSLGLLLTRLRVISFHRVLLPVIKSAIGVSTSGFCRIVHSTTSLGLYFSFSSFRRQTSRGSHLSSGVTGALELSLVPSIITNVSRWSSPWNSILLMTWATEFPPKDITIVWPLTKISFRSLTKLSPSNDDSLVELPGCLWRGSSPCHSNKLEDDLRLLARTGCVPLGYSRCQPRKISESFRHV